MHYQPKAAIFEFYSDVKMVVEANGHEVVIGKCSTCSQTIRGSRNVTSNFVTHVKVGPAVKNNVVKVAGRNP